MEQLNLYDYIGSNNDPVFKQISKMESGQLLKLGGVTITLTRYEFYEISTVYSHECCASLEKCYEIATKLIENDGVMCNGK